MSAAATPPAWRLFDVEVARIVHLSPTFRRLTFAGPDLHDFADNGFDTRCKLVLPAPDGGFRHLDRGPDWLASRREMPDRRRNPLRTYTVRRVRPGMVDVDVVAHGDSGPAGRWIEAARPGSPLVLVGPNAAHPGPHGGAEFRPPPQHDALLLAGDETAVPAIAAILEGVPDDTRGVALLEVPVTADRLDLVAPPGVTVTWLPRDGDLHGALLVPAVGAAVSELLATSGAEATSPHEARTRVDLDDQLLWDVPVDAAGEPLVDHAALYAWLAGEAGIVTTLRRHLVRDRCLDPRTVAFMGYWRLGKTGP
ncbi:siderophore-interacting protein [Salsipaludibacter albus]|uniref:siderophore-interacting protein n=1 Tax=Salsipaludibacter albus TaxID=2849650 RepID=UPI001EE44A6C|nr:siderophore-interacting protein [Salsipaludibacter albus]MBY5161595.1 siderophore-interacting protein [Salsipaludibacter albus]